MLDILQLHQPKDNRDARCWILANGKNLRHELDKIQSELLSTISKDELLAFLAKKS